MSDVDSRLSPKEASPVLDNFIELKIKLCIRDNGMPEIYYFYIYKKLTVHASNLTSVQVPVKRKSHSQRILG